MWELPFYGPSVKSYIYTWAYACCGLKGSDRAYPRIKSDNWPRTTFMCVSNYPRDPLCLILPFNYKMLGATYQSSIPRFILYMLLGID